MSKINTNPIFSKVIQFSSLALILQNLLMTISLGLLNVDIISETHSLIKLLLILDIPIFCLFFIIGILGIFVQSYHKEGWFLVAVGSLLFVTATLSWRPLLDFIPENPISDKLFETLIGDIEHTGGGLDFTIIAEISRALFISNTGLLIFSTGWFILVKQYRYLIMIYRIVNILLTLSVLLIILKIYISLPFILIFFGNLTTNSMNSWLRT